MSTKLNNETNKHNGLVTAVIYLKTVNKEVIIYIYKQDVNTLRNIRIIIIMSPGRQFLSWHWSGYSEKYPESHGYSGAHSTETYLI